MADLEKDEKPETPVSENVEKSKKANKPKKEKKKLSAARMKKLKYGGIATAITCVVVAIVIVVNILVNMLVEKYPLKLDLTESAKFEISDETIEYLKTLTQDVNLTVLMAESNFQTSGEALKLVSETLERYTQYSDKVHLSYIDPTTNPDVVSTYQANYTGSLTEGDIVISNAADDSKLRVVSIGNLFEYDQQKYYYYYYYGSYSLDDCITGFAGENELTSALLYVTDADPMQVGILTTANGEALYNTTYHTAALSAFAEVLFQNGYDIEEVDIYTGSLDPEVYDILVLPAPVNDLTATAIDALSAFLYNNGAYDRDLIYIADYTQSDAPNLEEFLESWGIQVTDQIAMEGDSGAAQQVSLYVSSGTTVAVPTAVIADTDYSADVVNTSLPIVAPLCRTIDLLWDSQTNGITSALLQTNDSVYLNTLGESTENADQSAAGAQTVMAVSTRKNTEDNITHDSNLLVMGSMLLSDYYVMQDASYNNAQYLISAINHMTGKDSSLVIASKDLTTETITITTAGMKAIQIFIFAIPSVVAAIGVLVFMRRKNK